MVATLKEIEQNQSLVTEGYCPEIETKLYESLGIKSDTVYVEDVLKAAKGKSAYLNETMRYRTECWELLQTERRLCIHIIEVIKVIKNCFLS